jgi:cytochrome c peroxidase
MDRRGVRVVSART